MKNTISKAELARICEVSNSKVRQWCNVDFFSELSKIGYKKNQRFFTPKQTEFLRQNLIDYCDKVL